MSKTSTVKITAGLARITKRPDYLAVAATGRKWITPSFIVQAHPPGSSAIKPGSSAIKSGPSTIKPEDAVPAQAGFTVSKKVGNAVIRNKARRRLKEAARIVVPQKAMPGWRYVFIGRQLAPDYPFEKMRADMAWALEKLGKGADLKSRAGNKHSESKRSGDKKGQNTKNQKQKKSGAEKSGGER